MTAADVAEASRWLSELPLFRRYSFTAEGLALKFAGALERGEWLLIADLPGGVGGAGSAWCDPQGAFGKSAYLRLIGVRADHAGRGVGDALLRHAEALATAVSDDIFLLVSDFNTGAQRFYERRGYRRVGALPSYVLPDVTELLYRKRLSAKEVELA